MGGAEESGALRMGVCGSGHWARAVHLKALVAIPGVALVGVWGRATERTAALASEFGIRAFDAFDALLGEVDAVSFAVPPDIQGALALRAADAGKHLLLEKPIADTLAEAERLVEVVERRQLATVTFLTRQFVDEANALIERARSTGHTRAEVTWSSKALLPGTPFTDSPWRNADYGTLWDLGPHVLSILEPVLGPVIEVEATRVRKARFVVRLGHAGGGQSSVTLDQMDETAGPGSQERYVFNGGEGVIEGGPFKVDPVRCFAAAVGLLVDGAGRAGGSAGSNLRRGRDIVAVLEAACRSIESGGAAVSVSRA